MVEDVGATLGLGEEEQEEEREEQEDPHPALSRERERVSKREGGKSGGRPPLFTAEKKQAFIEALERTECVRGAGQEVGVLPGAVAYARETDKAFGAALDAAIASIQAGRALAQSLRTMRVEARHDGFTAEKRRVYLETLSETGCRTDAAKVAGISGTTADRWRRKDEEFARLCAAALDKASSHIEVLAWERAVTGIEEPVIHHGKVVGTRIKRSDSIFRLLLIGSNKKKYGRMGAVGRKTLLKVERQRIEDEVRAKIAAKRPSFDDAMAELEKSLHALAQRKIREEGWTRGPTGELLPPGWKMVPVDEAPAEDAGQLPGGEEDSSAK